MKDNNGRVYARLSQLKAGDKVQVDDGFACIDAWTTHIVQDDGMLYIECDEGMHLCCGDLLAAHKATATQWTAALLAALSAAAAHFDEIVEKAFANKEHNSCTTY